MNLSQVNLFVEDFTTMLRFYRDALGFQTNEMDPGPPSIPMVNWASLRTGNARDRALRRADVLGPKPAATCQPGYCPVVLHRR